MMKARLKIDTENKREKLLNDYKKKCYASTIDSLHDLFLFF